MRIIIIIYFYLFSIGNLSKTFYLTRLTPTDSGTSPILSGTFLFVKFTVFESIVARLHVRSSVPQISDLIPGIVPWILDSISCPRGVLHLVAHDSLTCCFFSCSLAFVVSLASAHSVSYKHSFIASISLVFVLSLSPILVLVSVFVLGSRPCPYLRLDPVQTTVRVLRVLSVFSVSVFSSVQQFHFQFNFVLHGHQPKSE